MKTIKAKIFFRIFEIFFWRYVLEWRHPYFTWTFLRISFITYIYVELFKGAEQCEKNKNHACNTAHRYGALLPIAWNTTLLNFFEVRNVIENGDSIVIDVTDVIKYIISNISIQIIVSRVHHEQVAVRF